MSATRRIRPAAAGYTRLSDELGLRVLARLMLRAAAMGLAPGQADWGAFPSKPGNPVLARDPADSATTTPAVGTFKSRVQGR